MFNVIFIILEALIILSTSFLYIRSLKLINTITSPGTYGTTSFQCQQDDFAIYLLLPTLLLHNICILNAISQFNNPSTIIPCNITCLLSTFFLQLKRETTLENKGYIDRGRIKEEESNHQGIDRGRTKKKNQTTRGEQN